MMTLVVGAAVAGVVALAVRSLWKDHKAGKSVGGCTGDCAHCQGHGRC